MNPNTGTAPIFRTRRDADITRRIYERHPVLVDHSGGEEHKVWPVKYVRMFDMANDSQLFQYCRNSKPKVSTLSRAIIGTRRELYLPLYQGRMIHQFDHRANSVLFNSGEHSQSRT